MERKTCCFTGHRRLPADRIESIVEKLNQTIESLMTEGVADFISGGALGFDQMAASLVIAKKEMGKSIRLIFALPCKSQHTHWTIGQQKLYDNLLKEADEIVYVSEEDQHDCMKKRDRYMVERSAFCVRALLYQRSGTAQTVR